MTEAIVCSPISQQNGGSPLLRWMFLYSLSLRETFELGCGNAAEVKPPFEVYS